MLLGGICSRRRGVEWRGVVWCAALRDFREAVWCGGLLDPVWFGQGCQRLGKGPGSAAQGVEPAEAWRLRARSQREV